MKRIVASIVVFVLVHLANGGINQEHNQKASNYCGIINCDYYKATHDYYEEYIPIANLTNIQPLDGYILRFPMFVIGNANPQILFTDTDSPDFDVDNGYEFVFEDSRIAIRNKKPSKELAFAHISAISENEPTKLLIEVTDTGYIRLYLNNSTEPLIASFDPKPLRAKYVSFRCRDYDVVEYFFNCPSLIGDTLSSRMEASLNADDGELSDVHLNVLATQCQWHDALKGKELTVFNASLFTHSESHVNKTVFEIYVVFATNVRIAFSTDGFEDSEKYYEFVIEGGNNVKLLQQHSYDGYHGYYTHPPNQLASYYLQTSHSAVDPVKLTFEFSSNGLIEVYVGRSSYKPSISTTHSSPIIVNNIGLASGDDTRALYYFGCPVKNVTTIQYEIMPTEDFSKYGSLEESCTKVDTNDQVFTEYFALSTLVANVQPDGFLVRLPVYIHAGYGARILLISDIRYEKSSEKQYYTFVFDDDGNTSISKNRNILAKVFERDVLSFFRPVRFVLEVTTDGKIRIFTDHNKYRPLLEVQDPTVISDLKYIGFGGIDDRNIFYYNCSKIKGAEAEVDSAFEKNVQETETQSESSVTNSVTVTYPRDRQYQYQTGSQYSRHRTYQPMSQSSSYQRYPGNRESASSDITTEK